MLVFICQLQRPGIMCIVYFIEEFRDILPYLALLFARCIIIVHFVKTINVKSTIRYHYISKISSVVQQFFFLSDIINCCGRF